MDIEQKYKSHRRLLFAIVVRALLDLRSDSRVERESARQWLLEHGAVYLRAANISKPQSKIERLLGELKQSAEASAPAHAPHLRLTSTDGANAGGLQEQSLPCRRITPF